MSTHEQLLMGRRIAGTMAASCPNHSGDILLDMKEEMVLAWEWIACQVAMAIKMVCNPYSFLEKLDLHAASFCLSEFLPAGLSGLGN